MNNQETQGTTNDVDPASVDRVVMPCPFCGGTEVEFEEENYKWCKVNCVGCGASSGSVRRFQLDRHGNTILDKSDADERALAEWNRRAKVKCVHDLAKEFNDNLTADYKSA